jgi:hypothetical protein
MQAMGLDPSNEPRFKVLIWERSRHLTTHTQRATRAARAAFSRLLCVVTRDRRSITASNCMTGRIWSINGPARKARPYVRRVLAARPAVSNDRGVLWIGQSRAPSLARASHEGA